MDLVHSKQLKKKSNGVNIFNAMKSKLNKDFSITKFDLDFSGITIVSAVVFQEMISQMKSKLDGNFVVVVHNANPMIKMVWQQVTGK